MRLCDFYKIHSFLADLLYSNIDLSSSGHKLTKFHDLVKKNEVEKNSHFSHFFSNSAVSWLWGTLTVTKLKTKGPRGQKHVLLCSKNSIRKFQLVCWNFDFCILGRFLQNETSVLWYHIEQLWVSDLWSMISVSPSPPRALQTPQIGDRRSEIGDWRLEIGDSQLPCVVP